MYKCECGKEFKDTRSRGSHRAKCIVFLGEEEYYRRFPGKKPKENINVNERIKLINDFVYEWSLNKYTCDECGKVMDKFYGSGRFCSRNCTISYSKSHVNKLVENNEDLGNITVCECGFVFNNLQSYRAHCGRCLTHLGIRFDPEKHYTNNVISDEARAWSKDKTENDEKYGVSIRKSHKRSFEPYEIINSNNYRQPNKLKYNLIYLGLKKWKCESCNREVWDDGLKIPLELHHIDGDNSNNLFSNLMLLCNNCHARTHNYRGKNTKKYKENLSKKIKSNDTSLEYKIEEIIDTEKESRISRVQEFGYEFIRFILNILPDDKSKEIISDEVEKVIAMSKVAIQHPGIYYESNLYN